MNYLFGSYEKRFIRLTITFLIMISVIGCNSIIEDSPQVFKRSFYHWKSNFHFEDVDKKQLEELQIQKLYVHFFDVIWDKKYRTKPVAKVNFETLLSDLEHKHVTIVPVVFITNEVFQKANEQEIVQLANRITALIQKMRERGSTTTALPQEIQIDCDWTASTKAKYFSFLQQFKSQNATSLISATIRLYQIKYPQKVGIPPVERGVLMYYNMGALKSYTEENSILNNQEGKKYLVDNIKYALPLDVALPLFSWGVMFRNQNFQGILNNFAPDEANKWTFLEQKSKNWFVCQQDTVIEEVYFRYGDEIRWEYTTVEEIEKAFLLTESLLTTDTTSLILYHWNTDILRRFGNDKINQIYSISK